MLIDRLIGALRLDIKTYEDIEHDSGATMQAAIVIGILALGLGFRDYITRSMNGTLVDALLPFLPEELQNVATHSPFTAGLITFINVFLIWVVAAAIIYIIGTGMFGGKATFGEILRVTGFAQAPRLFSFLALGGVIPFFSEAILIGTAIWTIAANIIGIRQGLDISTGKTIAVILISYLAAFLLSLGVAYVFTLF